MAQNSAARTGSYRARCDGGRAGEESALREIAAISQALGCLYVIEGATLGGRTITRRLQASLGLTPETGGAFFAGYGAETGPRWQAFGAMLSAVAERGSGEDEIVASANRTFETMGRWLSPTF